MCELAAGAGRALPRAGLLARRILADLGREWARTDPERAALVTDGQRVSYGDLDRRADRMAAGLRAHGIGRHDRVVVQLPNSVEFVVLCLALFRLGALPVLALPAHRRAEIGHLCAHTEAVAYVTVEAVQGYDLRKLAADVRAETPSLREVFVVGDPGEFTALSDVDAEPVPLPAPDPSDVAFFLLSGGSTGLPKLIPRTHDDYAYQLRATAAAMGFGPDGVYLAALPVAHNAALGCPGVLGALRVGATAVLAGSPSPDEAFRLIARERVTLTTLMPPFAAVGRPRAGARRRPERPGGRGRWRQPQPDGRRAGDPGAGDPTGALLRHGRGPDLLHPPGRPAGAGRAHPGPAAVRR